ncbi:kelch repeat-containing protein [Erythrobacter sp. JK5]|uniref:kelch repeat-containing protein n=1 Tax=Erythrobacter sp. JK5 TaxID=2829500 RepID=UPI0020128B18|nr:kelch repeat-containing protein [Erythrobacter sp. JK5]
MQLPVIFRLAFAALAALVLSSCIAAPPGASSPPGPTWRTVTAEGQPSARHEAGFIAFGGKLYLIGGRGMRPVDIFDPTTRTWTEGATPPFEMHHFQPIVVGDEIWIVGAFTGGWPNETPPDRVWRYLPREDRFAEGIALPPDRLRGAAESSIMAGASGGRAGLPMATSEAQSAGSTATNSPPASGDAMPTWRTAATISKCSPMATACSRPGGAGPAKIPTTGSSRPSRRATSSTSPTIAGWQLFPPSRLPNPGPG